MTVKKPEWLLKAFSHARRKKFFLPLTWTAFLEVLAVCALLFAASGGLLVWRLMKGPIDVGFARDYIEEALRNEKNGIAPEIGDIVLSWPDLSGPLLLGFKKVNLYDARGRAIMSVDEAALSISKSRLLIGQIAPLALILEKPELKIRRDMNGAIRVGIADRDDYGPEEPAEQKEEESLISRVVGYVSTPEEESDGSPLAGLKAFRIDSASVVIEDEVAQDSWTLPRMDAVLENSGDGLVVEVTFQFTEGQETPSFFRMNVDLPKGGQEGQLMAELQDFDPWFFAQSVPGVAQMKKGDALISAQIGAVLSPELKPLKAAVSLSSPRGKFSNPDISAEEINYKDFTLVAEYDDAKKKLEITKGGLTLQDIPLKLAGSLTVADGGIAGPIKLSIEKLEQKRLGELWPPILKGDSAEKWLVERLSKGTFTDLWAEMNLAAKKIDKKWSLDTGGIVAGFKFTGMTVHYRDPLTPVTNGAGEGKFVVDEERLNIKVAGGEIGGLKIKSGDLEFTHILEKGKGIADVFVNIEGPLAAGLEYVALEPISMKRKFDLKQVKGAASLAVNVNFPTHKDVKKSEVKVKVEGTLSDIALPGVVKDLPLTGGPFKITATNDALEVKGEGALDGARGSFDYKEFVSDGDHPFRESAKANINTNDAMRLKLGVDLADFIEGDAPIELDYMEYMDGRADADIKVDLAPTHVFIKPFGYDKAPGKLGSASLKAKFMGGEIKEIEKFKVSAADLAINDANLSFRQNGPKTELSKGGFGSFVIGETKGSMNFDVDKFGRYAIKATSSFFDLGPFVKPDNEPKKLYDDPAMVIDLNAEKLKGADGSMLYGGVFHIDIDSTGKYDALEVGAQAGQGKVTVSFGVNEGGIRGFRMEAEDAGAALAAFGVYKNIRGGRLSIKGKAKDADGRDIFGKAEITDFKVVRAPTLARLVSAMSLPGLASLLNGEGLGFSKLQADYAWKYKPEGSVLHIEDGRTSGNSVGFSFEGDVDLATSTLDISGTMVPLSDINKFIGKIPLVGEILTGGSGLIAATYSVRGKTAEPGVMVNPLSVLTPGILRKILFE